MGRKKADVVPLDDPVLLSIDPGGTTGWSLISVHPEALVAGDVSILENILHWGHGQIVGEENDQASEVLGMVDAWPGCSVLIEDFILRSPVTSRELLSPVRITSKIEYGLYLAGLPKPHKQMPSEAMRVATNDRLKTWGFYQREGGLEHARDADRHGLTWLRKCKQFELVRRSCWPHIFGPEGEFYVPSPAPSDDEEELG